MAYCSNCGSEINSADTFCSNCGEQVKAAKQTTYASSPQEPSFSSPAPQEAVYISPPPQQTTNTYSQNNYQTKTPYQRPKRLYRSRDDRMIAGVCGGLGKYFNIDSNIIRIGFILLTLAYFTGVIAYIVLALFAPLEDINR